MKNGFTLIELMITVAIIGILASIAMPAYQDYTIRAQVAEAFTLMTGVKTAVAEYYAQTGSMPATNTALGLTATGVSGTYVTSVVNTAGAIKATFGGAKVNSKISGGTVTLTGNATTDNNITWACTYDGTKVVKKYLPSSC